VKLGRTGSIPTRYADDWRGFAVLHTGRDLCEDHVTFAEPNVSLPNLGHRPSPRGIDDAGFLGYSSHWDKGDFRVAGQTVKGGRRIDGRHLAQGAQTPS
jgi:hypothetical protein